MLNHSACTLSGREAPENFDNPEIVVQQQFLPPEIVDPQKLLFQICLTSNNLYQTFF